MMAKFQQQQNSYAKFLHSAILEIGGRMSSKMSSLSLSASDSVAHMWMNSGDLAWRREARKSSRSFSSLALLAQSLRFAALRFSVLSHEDCLNALPERARAPVPEVGQRVIFDSTKYANYLASDVTFIKKRNARHRNRDPKTLPQRTRHKLPQRNA